MARARPATDRAAALDAGAVRRAIAASTKAGDLAAFYVLVDMPNPSRSYFVHDGRRLHSLKAIVTFALREARGDTVARDFHAADAAARLRALGFDVRHGAEASV